MYWIISLCACWQIIICSTFIFFISRFRIDRLKIPRWGVPLDNGSWTGLIGQVMRNVSYIFILFLIRNIKYELSKLGAFINIWGSNHKIMLEGMYSGSGTFLLLTGEKSGRPIYVSNAFGFSKGPDDETEAWEQHLQLCHASLFLRKFSFISA